MFQTISVCEKWNKKQHSSVMKQSFTTPNP